jgi:epoxyqueuosine reductase
VNAADIKEKARALGFQLVGVAPAGPSPESLFYPQWLERGFAGEMSYLARQTSARLNPQEILPGVRSVIVCAVNYNSDRPLTTLDRARAWISRYAWGEDYHETLQDRLRELAAHIQTSGGETRAYVDTGPLLERVFAKYAGVGWFGKNTCIIDQRIGSWLFLGCVLTSLELDYDTPVPDRCGSCTRCIDACPTQAIVEPYVLDSRRCISYLTIELRGDIPGEWREGIGHHLFGCDICQDVCPWNRKAPSTADAAFQPRSGLFWPELDRLLDMQEDEWRSLIRGTAMKRAKVKGLLRNLMIVSGNSGVQRLLPKVQRFRAHADASVRNAAEWAAGILAGANGREDDNSHR